MNDAIFTSEKKNKQSAAEIQEILYKNPPPSIADREALIAWMDELRSVVVNIFYAIIPEDLWKSHEGEVEAISVELCGITDDISSLPRGMYLIDIPADLDEKYRDPLALAFVHFGRPPEGLELIPNIMSVVLPKPTAHEKISAKMFMRDLVRENEGNAEILEWAEKLI